MWWMAVAWATTIPVQGLLIDGDGRVMAGSRALHVALWPAEAASGSPLWEGDATVALQDGLFSANLDITASILATPALWMTVSVDGGAPSSATPIGWAPRAAFAADADTVDGKHADDFRPSTWVPAWADLSGAPSGSSALASYVDGRVAAAGTFLPLAGGTLTGALSGTSATFSGTVGVAAPTAAGHAATRQYVDDGLAARLPLAGGTLTGALSGTSATFSGTVGVAAPTAGGHAATRQYVDDGLATRLSAAGGALTGALTGLAATFSGALRGASLISDTTVKIGDLDTACVSGLAGQVRYRANRFEGCNGTAWLALDSSTGTTAESAGLNCKALRDTVTGLSSGYYWLDPDGAGANKPFQGFCDMSGNGGGWTRIAVLRHLSSVQENLLDRGLTFTEFRAVTDTGGSSIATFSAAQTATTGLAVNSNNSLKVMLGVAGGFGIYNQSQNACSWSSCQGQFGSGFDGSCGAFPDLLRVGRCTNADPYLDTSEMVELYVR
jgi:hypothetical protein